ncbi:MAG: alpha/beta fold hydrolase [Balneolaceae bacterium]|nr:alpha/beta fold hydrolase [Balneolaceae bacterium]
MALIVYLALLFSSHIWRASDPVKHQLKSNHKLVTVQAVQGDSLLGDTQVEIAYIDKYTGSAQNPPVVLLLHGSPVAVPMFRHMIAHLSDSFRVIAPNLPGYDASTREIPDYSMKAYSHYINQFMDGLNIEQTHIVGYSLGGGIALNLAHFHSEKVESIDMLSAIGVQELELMGSYYLNHAVHGIQLALIWTLYEAVPHFGMMENFAINVPYARSFYDSDQRPLREYLQDFKKPMLIQHGKTDRFVPTVAAKEHHRIVPQSKLMLYEGGHDIVQSKSTALAKDLKEFILSVETGTAPTYATADSVRISESKMPFDNVDFSKFEGISLALIMIIIALSTLVSEDLTCIGAGLMAARGLIGFWPAVIACFIGIVIGDMGLYLAGRWLGRPALKKAPFKWFVKEEDLDKSADWFHAKGPAIIIASRFLPGSRLPTYFSAGVIGAGFWMFSFYFFLAAIIWTPLLVGISMLLGSELINYFSLYKEYALWVFLGTLMLLVFIAKVIIPAFSYRGRKLLKSRYCRLVNWEFWPPYVLYLPVCFYVVYLWIRYRSLTIFTAANPAIPDGGFISESKSKILDLFKRSGKVAAYIKIEHDNSDSHRIERAMTFMEEQDLGFPIFIKPDVGQRGAGVHKVKSEAQLCEVIKQSKYDLIIQENLTGKEYGVFYYRYPQSDKGAILSITKKELMTIKGDGNKTIEELILENERAVCMAKMHIAEHEEHLYEVPDLGEHIELVSYGTHARGAIFSDGEYLVTDKLRSAMDEICQKVDGFYFGRFDIKTESEETLKAGQDLKIIEVNGVTSESTNIYDNNYSFWDAQKILMNQWKIAFEIGRQNVERGKNLSSALTLIEKLLNFRSKK